MIEMLVKPKRAERRPWEMFFVGFFYAIVSFLLATFFFGGDSVLREGSGLLMVIFTVICCFPFMYYTIKLEEGKDVEISDSGRLIKEHSKAVKAMMWLFLGFVVAFSVCYLLMPEQAGQNFNFQTRTFCAINSMGDYDSCVEQYGASRLTGAAAGSSAVLGLFANNIGVLMLTIIGSLIFGAGAIFILVWNASVIATAVGIFAQKSLANMPIGLFRYMIHGIPEIVAYFIGALAGGILSVAIIRRDLSGNRTWRILYDSLLMIIIAIIILVVAALMEVYLTPLFF